MNLPIVFVVAHGIQLEQLRGAERSTRLLHSVRARD